MAVSVALHNTSPSVIPFSTECKPYGFRIDLFHWHRKDSKVSIINEKYEELFYGEKNGRRRKK